ncbi:MAG: hypothetical protein Q8L11_02200 [Candidatus Moranbacteria bacterium]|nr:hypothetical protein [Candidatus Moranbacteria bacterium]
MGIKVEFNPDLALRDIFESKKGRRKIEECVPENIKTGKIYNFLKREQRIYWFYGEVSLIKTTTKGGSFSQPVANVEFVEVTHFMQDGEVWTKGKYKVSEVFSAGKTEFVRGCQMARKK